MNHFIQAPTLRLLDETGKQIGIVSKQEALRKGYELGLDVVEIAANAKPPVAKLIDFKKFKYQQAKKAQAEKKGQKGSGVKEIRLSPFIGQHDLEVKIEQARNFLKNGSQVKISIFFRGRQITRQQFGYQVINRFTAGLRDIKIVRPAHMEGRVLVTAIAPDKGIKLAS